MEAGKLKEKITFIQPVTSKNGYGQEITSWINFLTTKSDITYSSGNRVTENNEIINTYVLTFHIRYVKSINEQMRIVFNGKKYRVLSTETNRSNRSCNITGELINE